MHMLRAIDRLQAHYDTKYADSGTAALKPVRFSRYPRDRFEVAVYLGSLFGKGSYLEIGAGDGSTVLALKNKYDRLVATELSSVRVQKLQELFRDQPKVHIFQNNLEVDGLPFNDEEFDTVSMVAVIEHLIEPIGALREIHRVLKPGGHLIVDTPNIAKWTRRLKLMLGYFPSTASFQEGLLCYDEKTATDLHDEGHLHYFTFRSLTRIAIERAGFRCSEIHGYGKTALHRIWPQIFSEICLILQK
jgi:SAM-dependent methyltransferase